MPFEPFQMVFDDEQARLFGELSERRHPCLQAFEKR